MNKIPKLTDAVIQARYIAADTQKEIQWADGRDARLSIQLVSASESDVQVRIIPKEPVSFTHFSLTVPFAFLSDDRIFVNGFQSWTDSREYFADDKMYGFHRATERYMNAPRQAQRGLNRAGDHTFHKYPRRKGKFYAHGYGYVRRGETVFLCASLSDRSGYTFVEFDTKSQTVTFEKELEGVTYTEETVLAEFCLLCGTYDAVFDEWFAKMGILPPENRYTYGYTTWYNYYTNINLDIVRQDLEALEHHGGFEIFQIDDGYQTAVGDWFSLNKQKFPCEMCDLTKMIHGKKLKAGLWLAPFAAQSSSQLFKNHPDWFVKDENGIPYAAGPNWNTFYALDIYNPQVISYLEMLFDTVLHQWGFDMVKLDFLYAAAVLPHHNKTRGEIMYDAMELVRRLTGDKLLLACGVPMMPAFGNADFCRIGADVSLSWKRGWFDGRENASTPNAVDAAVFRRHLNGRAFLNDPDVFLLRDKNMHMNLQRRKIIATVNALCGNLLFCSDNVSEYTSAQEAVLESIFDAQNRQLKSAEYIKRDVLQLIYLENGIEKTLRFNVRNGKVYIWK